MSLFNKPIKNNDDAKVQAGRNSRFAAIVEKIDLIMRTSEEVEDLLSKTIFELQKPKEYYGRLRESILVGFENAGIEATDVKIDETKFQQDIGGYLPKAPSVRVPE